MVNYRIADFCEHIDESFKRIAEVCERIPEIRERIVPLHLIQYLSIRLQDLRVDGLHLHAPRRRHGGIVQRVEHIVVVLYRRFTAL